MAEAITEEVVKEDSSVVEIIDIPVIEEEPVKIIIEEENTLIEIVDAPVEAEEELQVPVDNSPNEIKIEAKEVEIKRISVMDPGKIETQQPELQKPEILVSDEVLTSPSFQENVNVITTSPDTVPVVEIASIVPKMLEEEVVFYDNALAPEAKTIDISGESEITVPTFRQEPSNAIKVWEAKRGSDLGELLSQWSEEENIKFTWAVSENYKLDKDIFISGTYKNAINVLFAKGVKNAPSYTLSDGDLYELNISY